MSLLLLFWGRGFSFAEAAIDYPKSIYFHNIMQNKGIVLGEVEAIIQDREGFMWLGGRHALLRYDGYDFLSIRYAPDPNKLADTKPLMHVTELFEDSRHVLWAATRLGLYRYDPDLELMLPILDRNRQVVQEFREAISALGQAPDGRLLVGAQLGLYVYDTQQNNFTLLTHRPGDPRSLPSSIIDEIFVDPKGQVWLGLRDGLVRIDWAQQQITSFLADSANSTPSAINPIQAISADIRGNIWAGSAKGVYRLNPVNGEMRIYRHDPADPHSLSGDRIMQIFVDRQGLIWIGTDGGGVSLYDESRDRFVQLKSESGSPGSISSNTIRRIYEDSIGDIWIGTYPSGVNLYDRSTSAIRVLRPHPDPSQGLLGANVEAVEEDAEGNLWIGANGVTRYNPKDDSFTHYRNTAGSDSRSDSASLLNGVVDSDGELRFGSWAHGILLFNSQRDRFDQLPADPAIANRGEKTGAQLNDLMVWSVYQDRQNQLWISTHHNGLTKYDKKTGIYSYYPHDKNDLTTVSSAVVWTCYEDSNGRFWVGTANGLNLMNRDLGTFKRYLSKGNNPRSLASPSVLSIYEDGRGRVWVGTDAGLHLYHPETDDFTVVDNANAFVDNGIRAILEDTSGNLWLGTNNGVIMFNPDTNQVRNFTSFNGEQIGGVATGAAVATRKGEMVFGTRNGLYIFNPTALMTNKAPPPVVLTDFRIFTRPVPIGGPSPVLSKVINRTDQITLDHTKIMISFGFAALNFRDSEKNQYEYKLEGFDDKWREVGAMRNALYTNLPAGKYKFQVRGSNNDGVWNKEERSVFLTILPPPWRTWWAYTLYSVAFLCALFGILKVQINKRRFVEQQNYILEKKVSERTAELRNKNEDIQLMLGNMRQGLFTILEDGAIHPEYSKYLEYIFKSQKLGGANALELLFDGSDLSEDSLERVKYSLFAVMGDDEINFSINEHNFPTEYRKIISGSISHISLDWSPICHEGVVDKIMVSVRDVTELKRVEEDVKERQSELDLIGQILSVQPKNFLNFIMSAGELVKKNKDIIVGKDRISEVDMRELLRNMHTIKGNSRALNFDRISNFAHLIESEYANFKNGDKPVWSSEQRIGELDSMMVVIGEYHRVFKDVLGRDKIESRGGELGGWIGYGTASMIVETVEAAESKFPDVARNKILAPINKVMVNLLSTPLEVSLEDLINSVGSIATQLNKKTPLVHFTGVNFRLATGYESVVVNALTHIFRNSVDHGIEYPDTRIALGKTDFGNIFLQVEQQNERIVIDVWDDGAGLNLSKLFMQGISRGKWTGASEVAFGEIANVVFESGLSTKDTVSDISGRGVGMDAARALIEQAHGTIEIQFDNPGEFNVLSMSPECASFRYQIALPINAGFVLE